MLDDRHDVSTLYDVAIIGGGPAGLAAALALGRACKRVLLCDDAMPRNARATHLHNFVTRDGIPPAEFRDIARAQLGPYETVDVRSLHVERVDGEQEGFRLHTASTTWHARRLLLCTGMIDEMLELPGFREAWGSSIFQCPYCHGWELRGRRWGYLALSTEGLQHGFPALLRSWTHEVCVFVAEGLQIPSDLLEALGRHGVQVEPRPVGRLVVDDTALTHMELTDGTRVPCGVLYAHPPQRHVDLVQSLGLAVDQQGYVQIDPMTRQTSVPGIFAAGDLTTRAQGAVFAAAAGTHAAGMINHDLCWHV